MRIGTTVPDAPERRCYTPRPASVRVTATLSQPPLPESPPHGRPGESEHPLTTAGRGDVENEVPVVPTGLDHGLDQYLRALVVVGHDHRLGEPHAEFDHRGRV